MHRCFLSSDVSLFEGEVNRGPRSEDPDPDFARRPLPCRSARTTSRLSCPFGARLLAITPAAARRIGRPVPVAGTPCCKGPGARIRGEEVARHRVGYTGGLANDVQLVLQAVKLLAGTWQVRSRRFPVRGAALGGCPNRSGFPWDRRLVVNVQVGRPTAVLRIGAHLPRC